MDNNSTPRCGKKKILIVSQCFYPSVNRGGPAVSVTNLAKAIAGAFDVSVLTTDIESGTGKVFTDVVPGKNELFGCSVYYEHLSDASGLMKLMDEINPQMLYISSFFSAEYTVPALRFAKKNNLPVILAPRGELQPNALSRKSFKKRVYLSAVKLAGLLKNVRFHATAPEEAEQIRKRFPKAEVFTVQNLPRIPQPEERTRVKTAGFLTAAAVCRVHPIKGILTAIEALCGVSGRVSYDVYGPVEDEAYYRECLSVSKKLPAGCMARFHGAVNPDELPHILADADVFLLPTLTENFGNAIVEAMLCGCPVIISNGTPWNLLEENGAGLNADTVSGFTQALNRFIAMDEAERASFSENVFRYISERLRTDDTVNQYIEMFGD